MKKQMKVFLAGTIVLSFLGTGIASAAGLCSEDVGMSKNLRSKDTASSFIHQKLGAVSGQILRVESDNGRKNILKGAVRLGGATKKSEDSLIKTGSNHLALPDSDGRRREAPPSPGAGEGSGFVYSPNYYGWEGCSDFYGWFIDMNDWIYEQFLHHNEFWIERGTFDAWCQGGYELRFSYISIGWQFYLMLHGEWPEIPTIICVPYDGFASERLCTDTPAIASCGAAANSMCSSYMSLHDEELMDVFGFGLLDCEGGQEPYCQAWGTVWWFDYSGGY